MWITIAPFVTRADISKSARAVYEKLTDWVEKEKERERLEDEALEQRFE
ncbi:hypothetical protein [Escherichia coli]|nr:hypothetical protein [Escherichia coli]EFN0032195.1 hypothetical protein [Escherichia coli]